MWVAAYIPRLRYPAVIMRAGPRQTTTPVALALVISALAASCSPQRLDRSGAVTSGAAGADGAAGGSGGRRSPDGSGGAGGGSTGGSAGSAGSGATGGSPDAAARDAKPLPPLSDALAASCADLPAWQAGNEYQPGDSVTHGSPPHRFQCKPWPYSGWCPVAEYEPAGPKGHWPDAWNDQGVCP